MKREFNESLWIKRKIKTKPLKIEQISYKEKQKIEKKKEEMQKHTILEAEQFWLVVGKINVLPSAQSFKWSDVTSCIFSRPSLKIALYCYLWISPRLCWKKWALNTFSWKWKWKQKRKKHHQWRHWFQKNWSHVFNNIYILFFKNA